MGDRLTYIRTHEGWLYLAVVMDLSSRLIVGWSMDARMGSDLVLNALLMAIWRRQPKGQVMVHSDQGSQFSSPDWQDFLKAHHLQGSIMSRRGNCHDNAVAESIFQLLKRERIKRKIYTPRGRTPDRMSSITSRCFTTPNAGTAMSMTCLRHSTKSSLP